MSAKVIRCSRCGRRMRSMVGWNGVFKQGVAIGYLCPGCQTPEENAESEINLATTDYGMDELGRVLGFPKVEL